MASGRFITFEGGEGAGKSTQVTRLASALRAAGVDVAVTREPGGAPGAEEIRKLLVEGARERWSPWAEALLHYAARREHLDRTVLPALAAGRWVISDRFADSTVAYQGYGHGLGPEKILALHRLVAADVVPDLTLVLDLPVGEGLARAAGRPGAEDRYERMGRDFHEKLRRGFLAVAAAEPERCVVIDATRPVDDVAAEVLATVRVRLNVARQKTAVP